MVAGNCNPFVVVVGNCRPVVVVVGNCSPVVVVVGNKLNPPLLAEEEVVVAA